MLRPYTKPVLKTEKPVLTDPRYSPLSQPKISVGCGQFSSRPLWRQKKRPALGERAWGKEETWNCLNLPLLLLGLFLCWHWYNHLNWDSYKLRAMAKI